MAKYIRLGASKLIDMKGGSVLEDYLVAVLRLEELYGVARTSSIAKILGVTPATVTKVLQRLAREGYLVWEPYRGFRLAPKGLNIARKVIWRHRVAEVFLHKVLGFDEVQCHKLAHMLEHMPDEFFYRLYNYLGRPERCPHGNPIPSPDSSNIETIDDDPLSCMRVGEHCIVSRVLCFVSERLIERAKRLGIGVGSELLVVGKNEECIEVEIASSGEKACVDYELARIIRCCRR